MPVCARVSKVLSIVTLHSKYRGRSVGTAGGERGNGGGGDGVGDEGGGGDLTRETTCPRTQDTP